MTPPLLSICIPTYNRARRLDLLLHSLAEQIGEACMPHEVEIVLSDNASGDGTQKLGEKWASLHPFIHYFRNSWNVGGDANQLRAVGRGTGKFAWILGDDDRVREKGVARVLSYLKPGVTQLFLDFRCITIDGECLAPTRLHAGIPDDITTVELIKRLGYVSVFSLISSHVFDREKFLALDLERLLKVSPWYIVNMALIMAFHDQRCTLVRDPVLDYIAGNDRLPEETTLYVRVVGLLNTFTTLMEHGKIDSDFLFGIYETGAGSKWTLRYPHYFREELYGNLLEMISYWALPGRTDSKLIRRYIDLGPGFWGLRNQLKNFFVDDFESYRKHKKPIIHYWYGKTWIPSFSILLSSDDSRECAAFDEWMGRWPEEFAHESILISRLPEEEESFENVDVFMAPYRPHRSPSASLNSGFRKTLGARVLVLNQIDSPRMAEVITRIDEWHVNDNAPPSCLLFETGSLGEKGGPGRLLGLYLHRKTFVEMGAFENNFEHWSRTRLLADAGLRLRSEAWAADGAKISSEALERWFQDQLPTWLRILRTLRRGPVSEHGLNITLRHHLRRQRKLDEQ